MEADENKMWDRFVEASPQGVLFHKSYWHEALCDDVYEELQGVEQFLAKRGCRIVARMEVPKQLAASRKRKVSEEDYQRIEKCVNELWNRGGL